MQIKHLHTLIEPIARSMGLVLWSCDLHQGAHQTLLRVFLDKAQGGEGVSLEDCTKASREISAILDVEDPIKNRYQLEVSSPGINRTLSMLAHFEKYIGSVVKIKCRVAIAQHKNFEARIEKVADDIIFLRVNDETISVTLGDIQRATLVFSHT
jgi:ribosome maturation factor RimP